MTTSSKRLSTRTVWLAGHLVSTEKAKINILSPTAQYGINVFENIRCYASENRLLAFRLEDHINRLLQSAKILRLTPKYKASEIQKALVETIEANNYTEDISVRIMLYIDQPGSWAYKGNCEMLISPIPMKRAYHGKSGISVGTSTWERINDRCIPPRIKAGANYINSRMAQLEAQENGYDTALLLNKEGKVSEAPGACIFAVRQDTLITPPITSSILESITRDTVLEISRRDLKLKAIERDIDRTELYTCNEAFLCGTAAEITPITSLDKITIGDGNPGEITKRIRSRYFDIVRGKVEKYKKWIYPIRQWQ